MRTVRPEAMDFTIAIEYPTAAGRVVHSRGIKIFLVNGDDDETQITSCGALSVYADDRGIVWAEAELWADADGKPIFSGQPYVNGARIETKIFNCNVREIRSLTSFSAGYRDAHEYITGRAAPPRLPLRRRKVATT